MTACPEAVKGSKGILPGARLRPDQMPVTVDMATLRAAIDELDPDWDSPAPWLVHLRAAYTEVLGSQRSREIGGLYVRAIRDALARPPPPSRPPPARGLSHGSGHYRIPSAQIALTLTDYTTPTPLTVPVALVGDTILPQERPQESNSQFENTASGKAHVGELVNGQAAPLPDRSLLRDRHGRQRGSHVAGWVRAGAEPEQCCRDRVQLARLLVAADARRKPQVKGVFAIYNEGGVTHTKTIP